MGTARGIAPADLELMFHVYPTNSVQSLHLHMVDSNRDSINPDSYYIHGPESMGGKALLLSDTIQYFQGAGRLTAGR